MTFVCPDCLYSVETGETITGNPTYYCKHCNVMIPEKKLKTMSITEQNIRYVRRETSKAVDELNYAVEHFEMRGEKIPQHILDAKKIISNLHNNIINCVGKDLEMSDRIRED
jgi:hypothetical protein